MGAITTSICCCVHQATTCAWCKLLHLGFADLLICLWRDYCRAQAGLYWVQKVEALRDRGVPISRPSAPTSAHIAEKARAVWCVHSCSCALIPDEGKLFGYLSRRVSLQNDVRCSLSIRGQEMHHANFACPPAQQPSRRRTASSTEASVALAQSIPETSATPTPVLCWCLHSRYRATVDCAWAQLRHI